MYDKSGRCSAFPCFKGGMLVVHGRKAAPESSALPSQAVRSLSSAGTASLTRRTC